MGKRKVVWRSLDYVLASDIAEREGFTWEDASEWGQMLGELTGRLCSPGVVIHIHRVRDAAYLTVWLNVDGRKLALGVIPCVEYAVAFLADYLTDNIFED